MAEKDVVYYRAALEKITKREGPWNQDFHAHAENAIDAMAEIAEDALAGTWVADEQEDG